MTKTCFSVAATVLWPAVLAAAGAAVAPRLSIYLPREAVVAGDLVEMGKVGIVRGDDSLVAKAQTVRLGRFAVTGQQITLDRRTILGCLTAEGMDARSIDLRGAEQVIVRRNEQVINADRFIAAARAQLDQTMPKGAAAKVEVTSKPQPWAIAAGAKDVQLRPRPPAYPSRGVARIVVDVVADGLTVGHREIAFTVRYERRRAVAAADIPAGTLLGPENTRIETIEASEPEPKDWSPPFGRVAKRRIRQGGPVEDIQAAAPETPTAVKRRQKVVVKFETSGLLVSALGEALDEGKTGEFVKVKMGTASDARIITARIRGDGTLEPWHEGMEL